LETFTAPKELTEYPHYKEQRQKSIAALKNAIIDEPIREIIKDFNKLPYCFTMQSCYGHFLYNGQKDPHSIDPLPVKKTIFRVEYKIAYIAFCIEGSDSGRRLLETLEEITDIDPQNIQFCCAEWFWKKQINSYALQVEPDRFKHEDKAILDYKEALNIEKIRNMFFAQLKVLLRKQQD
jgi:hypothetical protein